MVTIFTQNSSPWNLPCNGYVIYRRGLSLCNSTVTKCRAKEGGGFFSVFSVDNH